MPTKKPARTAKDVFEVDWPLFGELSRALALRVSREFDPEVVIGVATAGVVPGAVVAAMLDRPFHSILVSRRYHAESVRETPAVLGAAPHEMRGKRVLIVDETCDSGQTLRLAIASIVNAGATDVRTAVSFRTGDFRPDYFALETESEIVLPWDKEILIDGALAPNPKYDFPNQG
jgi:hypoxanthine phosphoribosyltransferase